MWSLYVWSLYVWSLYVWSLYVWSLYVWSLYVWSLYVCSLYVWSLYRILVCVILVCVILVCVIFVCVILVCVACQNVLFFLNKYSCFQTSLQQIKGLRHWTSRIKDPHYWVVRMFHWVQQVISNPQHLSTPHRPRRLRWWVYRRKSIQRWAMHSFNLYNNCLTAFKFCKLNVASDRVLNFGTARVQSDHLWQSLYWCFFHSWSFYSVAIQYIGSLFS